MDAPVPLRQHPDRLLPAGPGFREVARRLYAPRAVRRFRAAVTETAGFSRTSGFIDDTRAFCSVPARHDMARRLDSGYLARLVAEHLLDEDEALETAVDLVAGRPREVFEL
jgi:glucuronate isomerase